MSTIKSWMGVMLLSVAACNGVADESSTESEASVGTCDYPQQFGNPQHTGKMCAAQHNLQVVARLETDADADAENEFSGFLQIHEGAAVTSGNFVIVPHSSNFNAGGTTDDTGVSTKQYDVRAYQWLPSVTAANRTLAPAWQADSDWAPVDVAIASFGYQTNGYVQAFQPVISGGSVYVPGRSGTVVRRSIVTGALEATIDPFVGSSFSGDPLVVQAGALSVGPSGKLYYTVTAHPTVAPFGKDPRNAWLVEITPGTLANPAANVVRTQPWSRIALKSLGIPQTTDLCARPFRLFPGHQHPLSPDDHSNMAQCGAQRPATNAPVAFDAAGNIVALSYATRELSAEFLIHVSAATLAPISASDTRGHLLNGCGVRVDIADPDCQAITAGGTTQFGFDPDFNTPVRFQGGDIMDSAPAVASNGDVSVGGYTGGENGDGAFDARGAGMSFTAAGLLKAVNELFFWEVTLAALPPTSVGGEPTYVGDFNEYSDGSFSVARWTSTFGLISRGSIPTSPDAAFGDWLDTQSAVNADGTACGVNAQGFFGCFDAAGNLVEGVDLTDADGTPVSMETLSNHTTRTSAGDYVTSYAGSVWVISGGGPTLRRASTRPSVGVAAKLALSRAAKQATLASALAPSLEEPQSCGGSCANNGQCGGACNHCVHPGPAAGFDGTCIAPF